MRIHLQSIASYALSQRGAGTLAVGLLLAACSSSNGGTHASSSKASAAAVAPAAKTAKDPRIEAWHDVISKSTPPKDGCFHASYPSTSWTEVPCGTAPDVAVRSRGPQGAPPEVRNAWLRSPAEGETANNVGNGADWFVHTSGPMVFATGSFLSVTGATSVDDFSVQLNTNEFPVAPTISVCAGIPAGKCNGWQQAVYSSPNTGPTNPTNAYIQYWLLGYPSGCPSGWNSSNGSCFKNSGMVSGVPSVGIADLSSIQMEMEVGSSDLIRITVEGEAYMASFPTVLGLDNGSWNLAEFGVFGDYNANTANLSGNTTIAAQILTGPTSNSAICTQSSCSGDGCTSTGEQNNLNLVPQCCLSETIGGSPIIQFEESNVSGQSCSLCGGQGQSCCTPNGGTWCASSSNVCNQQICEPCGGSGQLCCAGNSCSGDNTCQEEFCGPPRGMSASPTNISAAAADGDGPSINRASTQVTASGAWAGNVAPSFSFSGLPAGVSCGASNDVAPNAGPSTITCTTSASTPLGTYPIVITATISPYPPESTTIYLTVTGCQALTCSDLDYVCGPLDNGCGQTLNCGTCPSGETCTAGECYRCAERSCPVPEYFNLQTCECQACPCGTIHIDGHYICAVCR
jgi:hypothetical protein